MLRLSPLVLVVLLAACAAPQASRTASRSNMITPKEVQSFVGTYRTAYQLVERSRPHWLRKRSNAGLLNQDQEGDIMVYVEGMKMGGPTSLRDVTLEAVHALRYLGAAGAVRYGMGHQHGVIEVYLR